MSSCCHGLPISMTFRSLVKSLRCPLHLLSRRDGQWVNSLTSCTGGFLEDLCKCVKRMPFFAESNIPPNEPDIYAGQCQIDGSMQACSISIANALEILQSCTKPSKCGPVREGVVAIVLFPGSNKHDCERKYSTVWLWARIYVEKFSVHYSDVIMGMIGSKITSPTIVYSTVYSDTDQRKHQSSASLAFVRGIHRWQVNSPHK